MRAQVAELDEVRDLERRLREQDAVVRDDADQVPVEAREAGHDRSGVALLELVEPRAVHDPGDDLAHVVRHADVGVDDAVELARVVARVLRRGHVERSRLGGVQRRDDGAREPQRVIVVFGHVVGDAGQPRVHVGAAQFLGGDLLAGGRLHQRRAAEEDRPRAADDDRFVRHRGHVGAAGRAGAHHDGDLRDALGGHARLVVEDAAEVVAVGEDLGLQRQERAARVDEVDARQAVVERDLLRPEVLLHGDGEVGAALHRGVVRDDHHLAAAHAADAGDQAGAWRIAAVHPPCGQGRELEKRRARIEQAFDALADRQLALLAMAFDRPLAAAAPNLGQALAQLGHQALHARAIADEQLGIRLQVRLDDVHRGWLIIPEIRLERTHSQIRPLIRH